MTIQQISSAALPPDVFDRNCPTRQVLDRVGDRWTVLVVLTLTSGSRRFTELRGCVAGITPKMLTSTLRGLERDGLVSRRIYAEVPPRVEYTLTPLGRSLCAPMQAITDWAEEHIREIEAARDDYDRSARPRRARGAGAGGVTGRGRAGGGGRESNPPLRDRRSRPL